MAKHAVCPSCGRKNPFAEGKVRCKGCGERFVVESDEEDKPKATSKSEGVTAKSPGLPSKPPALPPGKGRSRRRDDDDDRPYPRSQAGSGNMMLFLIGGGAVAVLLGLCLVGGVASYFMMGRAPDNPKVNEVVVQVKQEKQEKKPAPPDKDNNPPVDLGKKENPKNDPPKKDPPKKVPPKKDPPPVDPPAPIIKWNVKADPGPDLNAAPENANGTLPLFGTPHFVFPSTPSPFVAVRHGQIGKEGWQVIDLKTFKQVAGANGKLDLNGLEALSPDGKLVAGKGKFQLNSTIVNVYSFADARIIQAIQLDTKASSFTMIDFIENGHLITYKTRGLTGFYEVYNIATGMEVKRFTVEGLLDRKNNLALSAGRKYLAVAHKNQIDIFQPLSGEQVGEIKLGIGDGNFKALAFSQDGTELACLTEASGSSSRLMSWKMADGKPGVDHKFAKDVQTLVKNPYGYSGPIMEWVPDNSGWLLYGRLWVDYQSGAPVHTIAFDAREFRYWPRRLIGKDHVVMAGGDFTKSQMGIVSLPRAQIAAAIKTARAGGGQVAALPAAKPADLTNAKTVPALLGDVAWGVEADPAPAVKGKLAVQPIQLRAKPQEILQILFSSGDVGQAVVISALVPNPLAPRKQYRADRHSLTDGKHLGACELFASDKQEKKFPVPVAGAFQADVSPDGARLIVRHPDDLKRLDVWNLADSKHLVGWQPHEGVNIDSFALVDADRVVTCGGGKLILWKIPECQAVYIAEGYRGALQMSPGRKYIAVSTGTSLCILETATGTRKGQFEQPGGQMGAFQAGAFSRDGKEFAAALGGTVQGGSKLARWSLDKGKWTGICNDNAGARPMAFMGKHLLQGQTLFDWNLKGALWTYGISNQGVQATGTPDGRHWFATGTQELAALTAQTLPDKNAGALAAMVSAGGVQPVVTPGMAIQFQINAGSEKFRTQVQASLQARLQQQGFKQGPGGLNIAISAQEGATGAVIEYEIRNPGMAGRQIVKINERQVACQYVITDAAGVIVSKSEIALKTPGSHTFEGMDYERQLNEAIWNNATGFGSSVPIPTNVYRIQGQLQTLPRFGSLVGGG